MIERMAVDLTAKIEAGDFMFDNENSGMKVEKSENIPQEA